MTIASPFSLLKEHVNPMISGISPDMRPSEDPFIKVLGKEEISGFQQPEAGELDIYAYKSQPAVIVGDVLSYKPGTRQMGTGQIKFKKITQQLRITEDELVRIEQHGNGGIVKNSLEDQKIQNNLYFISQIQRWAINRWEGVTTDEEYDAKFKSLLHPSDGGTITEPSDLNATAGTPLDISATTIMMGTNQTANNIQRIMSRVRMGMTKIDFNTKMVLPISNLHVGVHPLFKAILDGTTEILNTTSGQRGATYSTMLGTQGVTIIESTFFDSDYAGAEDGDTQMTFFANPKINFKFLLVTMPSGMEAWSNWRDSKDKDEASGRETISYEIHKAMEFGFFARPYWVMTTASAGSFFSPKFIVTVQGLNDA